MSLEKDKDIQTSIGHSPNAYEVGNGVEMAPPEFSLTAGGGNSETKLDAYARHGRNTTKVQGAITDLKNAKDTIERNSGEWLEGNFTNLFVGTQTHDSEARADHTIKAGTDLAYFGARKKSDAFPSPNAVYDDYIQDYKNVKFFSETSLGSSGSDHITILDPEKNGLSTANIKETLVHEVQHNADQHRNEGGFDGDLDVNKAWSKYKSEFRSYWLEGMAEGENSVPDETWKMSDRQFKIYSHIKSQYSYVTDFDTDVVSESEKSEDLGETLHHLIYYYKFPDGINLENSPRIESFYRSLQKCTPTMTESDPEVRKMLSDSENLNKQEKVDMLWDDNKKPLLELIDQNLSATLASQVKMHFAES